MSTAVKAWTACELPGAPPSDEELAARRGRLHSELRGVAAKVPSSAVAFPAARGTGGGRRRRAPGDLLAGLLAFAVLQVPLAIRHLVVHDCATNEHQLPSPAAPGGE